MIDARLLVGDVQPGRQPVRRQPVGDAEVHHLRHAALVGGHLARRHAEDLGGGAACARPRRAWNAAEQARVLRRRAPGCAARSGCSRRRPASSPARPRRPGGSRPSVGADGDVLEVGVGARRAARSPSPPGGRWCAAARRRATSGRQRVQVGALQLGERPVLEERPGQRVLLASFSSTSWSVDGPVLPLLSTGSLSSCRAPAPAGRWS